MKYYRKCHECKRQIEYKNKTTYNNGIRKNTLCNSCLRKGTRNPFFGKHHTQLVRRKLSKQKLGKPHALGTVVYEKGHIPHGRAVYDIWVEKYGIEIANHKKKEWIEKERIASTGKNNAMYGKPSPRGSGNGWSGWYKGKFFRSLIELGFIVNFIEANGLVAESGELKKYKIPYKDYTGQTRNYFPDFVIGGCMYEIKPHRLHNTPLIKAKAKAARKFCKLHNLKFKLIDFEKLSLVQFLHLIDIGAVILLDRYKEKLKNYVETHSPIRLTSVR